MSKEFEDKVMKCFERLEQRLDRVDEKLDEHSKILELHTKILNEHSKTLQLHTKILNEHSKTLQLHTKILNEHSIILDNHAKILGEHTKKLDEHAVQIRSLHESVALIENKVITEFPALFEAFKLHQEIHKEYDDKLTYLSVKTEENSIRISSLESRLSACNL